MEHSFAEELYSDSLQLSKGQQVPTSTDNASDGDDVWEEDASLWDDSEERLDNSSDLDREWQRRREQFFTIGYRDGLLAGKEASAQEGFNIGYKQSVPVGCNWGLVRGVTSALAFLPDGLKEKLIEGQEKRDKYRHLHESVHSLSTSDALKLFSAEIISNRKTQHDEESKAIHKVSSPHQSSEPSQIGAYVGELKELLGRSPAIEVHLDVLGSSTP
ncbi:protein YAE1-like [Punica granatum]|nr:protein YAE1-like [Punica granatum]PKI62999.1 hypothetical protein CRG98_016638 [Punica granatum]